MSSDGYFEDDIDQEFLNQLDVIEASQLASSSTPAPPAARARARGPSLPVVADDSDYDMAFDVDEQELQKLDVLIEHAYHLRPATKPQSNGVCRQPSKGGIQTTLFGGIADTSAPSKGEGPSKHPFQRSKSTGQHPKKTKVWDHTAYAKSGPRKRKSDKGKGKAGDDVDGHEEEVEFEQFPAPLQSITGFSASRQAPPMKQQPDLLATKHWLFPLNQPRRDYQFNISKHCLFDNTLVALPTGLGKTFIAGVVMLNYYRWFPEGKIVFVAPTKPLVAQQVEACHRTCGIPGRDAVELTGNNPRTMRARAWETKRVFYMTPQTLFNDLKTENCDIRDIVLLVIDEAHKGTGDYAYATVVRILMAKNPHFRVLALTATPGSTPDAVQSIIDALHISRIELRDEESLDIRSYVNKKKVEQHIIPMNESIAKLRDLLAKVMKAPLDSVASVGLVHGGNLDPVMFHPFRAQMAMQEINSRRDSRQLTWAFPTLKTIGALARAMGYLLEASPSMCYNSLQTAASGDAEAGSGKPSKPNKLAKDPNFQALMSELERQKVEGFAVHPKMEKLKTLVIQHFGQRMGDAEANGEEQAQDTKVMVFVSFREAVDEIVEFLNQESPLIRATRFIGQGVDKRGNKGFAQKEQLGVIKQFKAGEFNVLVSTSIGEEGLDIGEIDMIVCYEAQKTPIRMLQRVGRTGRKRDGFVHVLLAQGREELNWNKAQESYAEVQQSIVKGDQLEFYSDVERLLPEHVKPEALPMMMDIEEYERDTREKTAKPTQQGAKKRKRNDDAQRNIPTGASLGFVSVADLIAKQGRKQGRKKRKTTEKEFDFDPAAGEDDSTDEEIEAGVFGPKRSVSTPITAAEGPSKPKGKTKRAKSMAGKADKPKKTKEVTSTPVRKKGKATKPALSKLTLSQFDATGADDSEDFEIEKGIVFDRSRSKTKSRSPSPYLSHECQPSSPDIPLAQASSYSTIDICTSSDSDTQFDRPSPPASVPARSLQYSVEPVIVGTQSSQKSAVVSIGLPTPEQSTTASSNRNPSNTSKDSERDLAWLLADSDDDLDAHHKSSPRQMSTPADNSDIEIVYDGTAEVTLDSTNLSSSPVEPKSSGPLERSHSARAMPPPLFTPARALLSSSTSSLLEEKAPEPSFAIRAAGKGRKRVVTVDSSPFDMPPLSQKHLRHAREPTSPTPPRPVKRKKVKIQDTAVAGKVNFWIDVEAGHSGGEVSGGSSDAENIELESESDRLFLKEPPETQISPSYDQLAAYRLSLLSQAPRGGKVPMFANPVRRRGAFYAASGSSRPRRRIVSSSPPPEGDDGPDEYALGSFVVDDDAEISFIQSSES